MDVTDGRIESVPARGGLKHRVAKWQRPGRQRQVVPTREGVFLVWSAGSQSVLEFYRFATGRVETVYKLSATPDGRTLVFDRREVGCDLKVVEDFR
jgi:hypothetical protein